MPEFEDVEDFPSQADNLPKIPFGTWNQFLFAGIEPSVSLSEWLEPIQKLVGWMPIDQYQLEPARTRDYLVRANWALYVDNYLEGFHIPFIHADLNAALDYGNYGVETFEHGVIQIAVAKPGELVFDLPAESPHFGQLISAYYVWLFPNLMLNFYPWGLSINVVKPLAVDLTRVSFIGYVGDPSKVDLGAGATLDRVEREDEVVVELVHKGLKSRHYQHGRYSVSRENGTHHFHQLLTQAMNR